MAMTCSVNLFARSDSSEPAEKQSTLLSSYKDLFSLRTDERREPAHILASYGEPKKAYELVTHDRDGRWPSSHEYFFEARLLTEIGFYERADSALARACENDSTQWGTLIHIWRARLNILTGRHEFALEYLHGIDEKLPDAFERYKRMISFEALLGSGQNRAAVELGEAMLREGDNQELPLDLLENLIEIYIGDDSLSKAVRLAADLTKRRMSAGEAARIACKEIDLLYMLDLYSAAKEKTVALAKKYPKQDLSIQAVRWLLDRSPREDLATDELLLFARLLSRKNELAAAKKLLVSAGKRRLKPADVEERKIVLADLYYREKRYSRAVELARQKYTSQGYKRWSMLILARCYRNMGRQAAAAHLYEEFAAAFPADSKAGEALFVASELYARVKQQVNATRTLERLADTYPSGYFGHIAMLKLSWHHQKQGRDEKSAEVLQRTLKRSRRNKETTLYYLSEAYGRIGLPEKRDQVLQELTELDSVSFYLNHTIELSLPQQLMSSSGAVELRGSNGLVEFLRGVTSKKTEAFTRILKFLPAPANQDAYVEGKNHMLTARIFLEMGFRDWGKKELAAAERSLRSSKHLIFKLAMLYDYYGFAWNSMKWYQYVWDSIHGEERHSLSRSFSLLLHPLPFPVQVFENCARQGLPPHLVYAMIRAESGFDDTAVSRAGAVGLMQLMPGTGRDVARRLDLPDDFGEDLFSPEINLAFGIWYASFLFGKCSDDPFMMLAAYNAGLANARRWFRQPEDQTVPRVVDGITYKETRNYVKKIVESSHVYRNLYFDLGGSHSPSEYQR
jgi:soluble lytic murein transglycosylase